jgi:hypothetical protein
VDMRKGAGEGKRERNHPVRADTAPPRLADPPSGLGTGPGGELPGGVVEDHAAFGDTRSLARAQAGGLADREGAPLRAAEAAHGIVNLHGLGPRSDADIVSERRT